MPAGVNFTALLYRPIYDRMGVDAQLAVAGITYPTPTQTAAGITLVGLDKTEGVALAQGGGVIVETLTPVVEFIVGDILALGLQVPDLDGGQVTLNGRTWNVISHRMNPSMSGTSDGTVFLQVEGTADD